MNKKVNYALLIAGATIVNIVSMVILFILTIVLLSLLFNGLLKLPGEIAANIIYIAAPLVAIGGGYFVYSKLFKLFREKVDMEKYFEPIFKKKK